MSNYVPGYGGTKKIINSKNGQFEVINGYIDIDAFMAYLNQCLQTGQFVQKQTKNGVKRYTYVTEMTKKQLDKKGNQQTYMSPDANRLQFEQRGGGNQQNVSQQPMIQNNNLYQNTGFNPSPVNPNQNDFYNNNNGSF